MSIKLEVLKHGQDSRQGYLIRWALSTRQKLKSFGKDIYSTQIQTRIYGVDDVASFSRRVGFNQISESVGRSKPNVLMQ